eukprot:PLAT12539.27.p1 GENE.PLAT12539.27~~PLAT12539.27.p1  ORF type:complete len:767 (-),score=353.58 PLAT12539.27:1059-3359(-)
MAAASDARGRVRDQEDAIRVIVRVRPLSAAEEVRGGRCVHFGDDGKEVTVDAGERGDGRKKKFTFDAALGEGCGQAEVYETAARGIVDAVLSGYNGTVLAYGQTAAGKTWTMQGKETGEHRGIIPRSFDHIFERIAAASEESTFLVQASMLEVYMEKVRDLLSPDVTNSLRVVSSATSFGCVPDLSWHEVKCAADCARLLSQGADSRKVTATGMNAGSSRSHSVFTLRVESRQVMEDGKAHSMVARLNLVDLAGSERLSKTAAVGLTMRQGVLINKSLMTLGHCIAALARRDRSLPPYRDSKLTQLLQDSLGGNTKTVMIAALSPSAWNRDETVGTLRYAASAKRIRNKVRKNIDAKDALLVEYAKEVEELKRQLALLTSSSSSPALSPASAATAAAAAAAAAAVVRTEVVERVVTVGVSEEKVEDMRAELMEEGERHRAAAAAREVELQAEKARSSALAAAVRQREQQAARVEAEKARLRALLQEAEKHMLRGQALQAREEERERALAETRAELEAKRDGEARLLSELAELAEGKAEVEEHYATVADELADARAKMRRMRALLRRMRDDRRAMREQMQAEVARAASDAADASAKAEERARQLQLREMLLEWALPPDKLHELQSRAFWDSEAERWQLRPVRHAEARGRVVRRPVARTGSRRPTASSSIVASRRDGSGRHRAEDIIDLPMDAPQRTTEDWVPPEESVRRALRRALHTPDSNDSEDEGDDVVVDGSTHMRLPKMSAFADYSVAIERRREQQQWHALRK